jgi:Bacterial PH domain
VSAPTKPRSDLEPARPAPSRVDPSGVYRQRGRFSYSVIGVYLFLILIVVVLFPGSFARIYVWAPWILGGVFVLFLARYLSTSYSLDDSFLRAWRILGGRRVHLDRVHKIEYTSLRDLGSAAGVSGSWGWRGRMWSPEVGHLDAVYTDAAHGILVSGDGVPLYISPVDLPAFARELSRRVRSYTGRLAVDAGDPEGGTSSSRA